MVEVNFTKTCPRLKFEHISLHPMQTGNRHGFTSTRRTCTGLCCRDDSLTSRTYPVEALLTSTSQSPKSNPAAWFWKFDNCFTLLHVESRLHFWDLDFGLLVLAEQNVTTPTGQAWLMLTPRPHPISLLLLLPSFRHR